MRLVGKMKILNSYPLLASITIFCCLWRTSEQRKDTDCIHQCGNIDIPYPFGIGPPNCSFDPYFDVSCNSSTSSYSVPFLKKFNWEILNVLQILPSQIHNHLQMGSVIVKIPSIAACSGKKIMWTSHNLTGSSFRFSTFNVFASVGCDGYALFYNETRGVVAGCTSVCSLYSPAADASSGGSKNKCYGYHCCQTAQLFAASIFDQMRGIKQYSISVSTNNTSGNCRSAFLIHNPYLETMTPLSSEISAVPVLLEYGPPFSPHHTLAIYREYLLPVILSVGIPLVICGGFCGLWRFKTKKRRKELKLRAKYFKEKVALQGNSDATEKTKLFTQAELRRLTDNFSKDRVLGQGGQGTVYKGMLKDGQVIAVKRSKALDESQWKQFINEVILLSQIKHRHVVKILGCCLEDDIPLLVYEFICNGTLSEHIHKSIDEFVFTWEMRLRIAFETATAIAYLHSEFSTPIYHRDIKSSNILLDDKFGAKLSDFGISRAVSVEQTHLTTCVQGTFGYLDPEYFYSSQYSEKSDVYSFGVILVELLTGQKPIRALRLVGDDDEENKDEEEINLAMYFVSTMNDSTLFDIVDPTILESVKKEDIMEFGNLAKQCLNPTGLERPTMKEVTMVLEGLRHRNSSCIPLKPIDQAKDWTIGSSSITTSSTETGNGNLRSLTYDHIDFAMISDPSEVEMRLLHTS